MVFSFVGFGFRCYKTTQARWNVSDALTNVGLRLVTTWSLPPTCLVWTWFLWVLKVLLNYWDIGLQFCSQRLGTS